MNTRAAVAIAASVLGLSLAVDGFAQQKPMPPPSGMPSAATPAEKPAPPPRPAFTLPEGVQESSTVIGIRIGNSDGKDVGSLEQLLIDPRDGKVTHAVIGVGGVLGLGETKIVVPWSEVKLSTDPRNPNRTIAMMEQSMLDQAPRYQRRATADSSVPPAASPPTSKKPEK